MSNGNADWRAEDLGPARTLEVDGGRVRVHVSGDGPAVVFVHGVLVNANLWRKVVPRLDGFTRVTIDMPLGSHLVPMPARPLTPPDLGSLIGEAVTALGLEGTTLVGNDTGGALCQIAASQRPPWLGRLVLTSCDAFEHFPPPMLKPLFAQLRLPGGALAALAPLRMRAARRLPIAYGLLTHDPIPDAPSDSYVLPALASPHVRADLRRVCAGIESRHTVEAGERLRAFDRPALIAWSADDKFFPRADAERLAATIPGARLELIEGARTFSPEDRPEALAELIAAFARETVESAA
ncbi:MAG TPA: alpha/beta hydrolase [Conexibacter sp.]|jgi:pimeloyl-ACP methyl ester carboxylesterase|nr:alpha/beta hydrolase [Conexibacter sp.]